MTPMDALNTLLTWVVAPVAAVVGLLYRTQQQHATLIAVLEAKMMATKEAHDREIKEIRSSFKAVLDKLDDIETHLRAK
jgi:hypothetical protein